MDRAERASVDRDELAAHPGLRAAFVQARQRQAGPAYAVAVTDGWAMASNAAQRFDVAFVDGGVALQATAADGARLRPPRS